MATTRSEKVQVDFFRPGWGSSRGVCGTSFPKNSKAPRFREAWISGCGVARI